MPATVSAVTPGTTLSYGTGPVSFAHTAATDLLLVAVCSAKSDTGAMSVAYGGVPMTLLDTEAANGSSAATRWFFLKNPATGTANVVVTVTPNDSVIPFALNIAGADVAGTTFTATQKQGDIGTAISTTIAGLSANDLVLSAFSLSYTLGTRTLSLGSGLTSLGNLENGTTANDGRGVIASKPGGASVVMDATATTSWVYSTASFGVRGLSATTPFRAYYAHV